MAIALLGVVLSKEDGGVPTYKYAPSIISAADESVGQFLYRLTREIPVVLSALEHFVMGVDSESRRASTRLSAYVQIKLYLGDDNSEVVGIESPRQCASGDRFYDVLVALCAAAVACLREVRQHLLGKGDDERLQDSGAVVRRHGPHSGRNAPHHPVLMGKVPPECGSDYREADG